jgi:hypothetical protein
VALKCKLQGLLALGVTILLFALLSASASAVGEQITISPTSGPPGTTVTVNGSGWQDHASRGWDVPIQIDGRTLAMAHPDTNGDFSVQITIPESAAPGSSVRIDALLGNGSSASAWFDVTEPASASPGGSPGSGSGTGSDIDLEVTKIDPLGQRICAGSDVTFRAYIRNNGSANSGFFNIRWIADNSQNFDGGHYSIPPGATDTHDHIWKNLSAGKHTLEFIADFDKQKSETDENNNQFTLPFRAEKCSTGGTATGQPGAGGGNQGSGSTTPGGDTTKPGGMWVSPAKNFGVTGKNTLHLKARAYDKSSGGSGVAKVIFTAWWPGINPKVWHIACTKSSPTSGNVYECNWDISGVPNGPLMVSFDVYDKAGNKNLAPNGLRKGTVERNYAFKFPWDTSKLLNLTSGPHMWSDSNRSGLDFSDQNSKKSTRILAMADGKVTWAGEKQGACRSLSGEKLNCNIVEVSHSNGWDVWYVHLSKIAPAFEKQWNDPANPQQPIRVEQGQWLGNEGDSGAPGQVHLHLELRKGGQPHEWSEVSGGIEGWEFHKECTSYDKKKAAYDEKTGKQQTKACEQGNRGGFMSYGTIHALREYQAGPRYWIHSTNHEP